MKPKDLGLNPALPMIMHIDLNSCFAIIEQQANRLLRGRPVGVAAYDTPRGFVLAASYQAKWLGVKLGVNVAQARQLCPDIVIMTPDPSKYREAHSRFKEVLLHYTSDVVAKSIDEFVINLSGTPALRALPCPHAKTKDSDYNCRSCHLRKMKNIGFQIKDGIKESLGEAVTVNIGIGTNRFLAKLAAGLHKPDGLDMITNQNIKKVFGGLELMDFPGINIRYNRRLCEWGVTTPLEFLAADVDYLQKRIFKSIVGYYWFLRLRGWEIDNFTSQRRTIGHQYALPKPTANKDELSRLFIKLCERVGRRLRKNQLAASGIHLYLSFSRYESVEPNPSGGFIGGQPLASRQAWHKGKKLPYKLFDTASVYRATKELLEVAEIYDVVRGVSITVFNLEPIDPEQLSLGLWPRERDLNSARLISDALDKINNRYGEYVITPGNMMEMKGQILDRIAFGSVRDFI